VTKVKRILVLMADGKQRTKEEIAKELGISPTEAGSALRKMQSTYRMEIIKRAPVYNITKLGVTEARQPEPDYVARQKEQDRRWAIERRRRAQRTLEGKANAKISAEMKAEREERERVRQEVRAEQQAEKAEQARAKAERASMIWRAKSGQVPNSVFAMGSLT
jgi:DNA-binding Lrp family transcriptional regulator